MSKEHKLRALGLLTASEFWGSIGLQVVLFIAPLAAIQLLDATAMQVAILNLTESAAALVFGLGVGQAVDRWGGASSITTANLVRAAGVGALAFSLFVGPSLPILYFTLFLMGIASLLHDAGISTAIVEYVGRDGKELNRANSLLRTSEIISSLGGPGLGGAILAFMTFGAAALFSSMSFAIAAGCAATVWFSTKAIRAQQTLEASDPQTSDSSHDTTSGGVLDGLRYILRSGFLRPLAATGLHFNFFSAIFQAVFVIYCVRVLGFETWVMSLVGIVGGLGGLLGAAFASTATAEQNAKKFYALSLVIPAASVLVMLCAQMTTIHAARITAVALAEAVFSFCMVLCMVLFNTARQQASPDGMVGQIAATETMIALGGEVPGALIGGAFATAVSVQFSMTVALVGMLFAAVWLIGMKGWPSSSTEVISSASAIGP